MPYTPSSPLSTVLQRPLRQLQLGLENVVVVEGLEHIRSRADKRTLGAQYVHEGGQNPILKRIPKRGFNNANFTLVYQVVNVMDLDVFSDGEKVNVESLAAKRLVRPGGGPVKVLGTGEIKKKLTVVAQAFSASAEKKIVEAGGAVERT